MLIVPKPLNSFSGVNYNSKASMSLAVGPTYSEIQLHTNLTAEQVKLVSVVLNGDTIVQVSGSDLKVMESYKENPDGTGVFVIPFTNPNAKNQNGTLYGGLVTLAGEGVTLEVEIGDGVGETPPTPTLDAVAFLSPAQAQRIWLPRIRTHTMQANAIGWNDFTTFPAKATTYIKRAYFKGAVARLKVERDNLILFDVKKAVQEFQQKRVGRSPQTGMFIFDPTMYGFEAADALNTGYSSEFVFRVEASEVGAIPILVESIEQVGGFSK